ncbi:MAG: rRNA maturation RNase YbeY [Gammaproteobacteria bacterium]|nr:rRNA maturation RNase YbeY [Gammaproteobacteria bacterium]
MSSDIVVEVQRVLDAIDLPSDEQLKVWVDAGVDQKYSGYEMVIRIVDETESASLNDRYRHKSGATNVLSFTADIPEGVDLPLLGDLVICAPVVAQEAKEQMKGLSAHWAHMVVHGALHLQGYDHQDEEEAQVMELIEREVLEGLGFADPY